jgi:phage gp29-like protein
MVIRLLEAVRSGNVSTYEGLCRYQDEQISECVLGETGSTNQSGDGGSRARDEVGNQVRQEIVQADADLLCETLNRTLIYWMTRLNFPDAQVPILSRKVESEQMDNRAKRDKILFEMGIALTDEAIRRVYGADYQRTVIRAGGVFDLPQFAETQPDTVDIFSQRLRGQATPIVTDWLRIIQVLLDDSPTLADFQEKLERVFPDLPNDQLAQILTQAYGATQLAGYYEASGDAPRV